MTQQAVGFSQGRQKYLLVMLGAALAAVVWAYWTTLAQTALRWSQDPMYSHGYLVPGFALFLLWVRRSHLTKGKVQPSRLEGREADYVVTADGELISGISLTENFALHVPGLAQLQIVQETVDRFLFRIVRGADFGPASLERIAALAAERFGPGVAHACEFVERIPQEPSGKYRFCISRVANPFTRSREASRS
jgi:Transmembrane exosortase (Exosortase_EpsH)